VNLTFGQDQTDWFYPLVEESTPPGLLTTSSLVAIYVFGPDSMPTRDAAAAGTGAIATISSWTWDSARQGFYFTVPAITDPDPNSSMSIRTYWFGVNFRLQTSKQIQTVLRSQYVERVKGPADSVYVTDDDLIAYYNEILSYSTSDQRQRAIDQALINVKAELKAKGYLWARIHRADQLKSATTLKALTILCLSKIQQGNDKFALKYGEYKEMYRTQIDSVILEYDADGDGAPDGNVTPSSGTIFLVR
jgi:hypothetical protein